MNKRLQPSFNCKVREKEGGIDANDNNDRLKGKREGVMTTVA